MTAFNISLDHRIHPLQRILYTGIFCNGVAVVMAPCQVVCPVIKHAHPKLLDMEQVQLGDG